MSKLGHWREPNWYYDRDIDAPWPKRRVLELLRRDFKHRRRVKTERSVAHRRAMKEWGRIYGYLGGGVAGR